MSILTFSQVDSVDTSRREPIAEALTPPPERAEIIPEVRDSIQLAFRAFLTRLVSRYGSPVTRMYFALRWNV